MIEIWGSVVPCEATHAFYQLAYQWQTLIAGVLALIAALLTIWATNNAANRAILAAQEQTRVAREQTATTLRLERRRVARESFAFYATLEAAMQSVAEDIEAARSIFKSQQLGEKGISVAAYQARQRIKKTAFAEIRNACLKFGGQLTSPFLRLDKEIDDLSNQWTLMPTAGDPIRMGANEGLLEELAGIELQAKFLLEEAQSARGRCAALLAEADE